ncbi:hypothetical protein E2C01_101604 [Portunus trituberculatus]|uniref:Uncharacterized protein n=1 Tax=Portunus trituberculatus TaxID=210409 RepID=A0A5B7KMC3_PORTR|nr:hypothetical protein [Portunus trituberculatus]
MYPRLALPNSPPPPPPPMNIPQNTRYILGHKSERHEGSSKRVRGAGTITGLPFLPPFCCPASVSLSCKASMPRAQGHDSNLASVPVRAVLPGLSLSATGRAPTCLLSACRDKKAR